MDIGCKMIDLFCSQREVSKIDPKSPFLDPKINQNHRIITKFILSRRFGVQTISWKFCANQVKNTKVILCTIFCTIILSRQIWWRHRLPRKTGFQVEIGRGLFFGKSWTYFLLKKLGLQFVLICSYFGPLFQYLYWAINPITINTRGCAPRVVVRAAKWEISFWRPRFARDRRLAALGADPSHWKALLSPYA